MRKKLTHFGGAGHFASGVNDAIILEGVQTTTQIGANHDDGDDDVDDMFVSCQTWWS